MPSLHTAVLQAGRDPSDIISHASLAPVSLAQTGMVPAGSMSVLFKGYTVATPPAVTLGGESIPLYFLETHPTYKLYGGNIPPLAGTIAELRFTAFPDEYPRSTIFAIDSILFSNQLVPEPSMFGLFALGALLLGWQFTRRHKKTT